MSGEVLVEHRGNVVIITINRPKARNAVDRATAHGIAAAIDEFESDPATVVAILTGADGTFCSGMDLKAFVNAGPGDRPAELEGRGFAGITETPPIKPLIAAVEGYALAGGCELALACDMIVAAENAVFGLPEVTRGLVAGSGGLLRLPRRIPHQIAMEYALTGAHMSAGDAHRWGLVNTLTPNGASLDAALQLAGKISANAPLAVRATKRVITESADWPLADAWSRQLDIVDSVLTSSDAHEGSQAFAEKRPAVWTGQ